MIAPTQLLSFTPVNRLICADSLSLMRSMPARSVDTVIGSPPYPGKWKRYRLNNRGNWHEWFAQVLTEAGRITRGWAFFVVNGSVKDGEYDCEVEEAVVAAKKMGCRFDRPLIWHKNAPPSRKDYFGNDWEFILAAKCSTGEPEFFDWESIAQPPKYTNGGRFRQRTANGERRLGSEYPKNKLTRPRDVLRVIVGGGHLGSDLAHENEAPFPEKLVEPLILTCCPKGGVVFDPFAGSATVPAVAILHGRNWIGCDVRQSQIDLGMRRIEEAALRLAERSKAKQVELGGADEKELEASGNE